MKIVIDIPEHIYNHAIECSEDSNDEWYVMRAIAKCKILPKGHGRLIDADSIYQIVRPIEQSDVGWGMTAETAIRLIHEAFNRAPTIMEADMDGDGT